MAVALSDIFVLGVRMAGPRQVLSGSRRDLGGSLEILGVFAAGFVGFPSRLALDSMFKHPERVRQPK